MLLLQLRLEYHRLMSTGEDLEGQIGAGWENTGLAAGEAMRKTTNQFKHTATLACEAAHANRKLLS